MTGREHNSPKSAPTHQQPANGIKQPHCTMSFGFGLLFRDRLPETGRCTRSRFPEFGAPLHAHERWFRLACQNPTESGRPPSCRSWSSPPRVRRNRPLIQPQAALHRNPRRTGCVAGLGRLSMTRRMIRVSLKVNGKKPRPCSSMRQPSLENTNAPGSNASSQRVAESAPRLALDSTSARQKRRTSLVFCTDFPSWSPSSVGRRSTRWPNSCNRARICACIESPA